MSYNGYAVRTAEMLERFVRGFGVYRTLWLTHICSDLWKPYLDVIARWTPRAVYVFDRYQIVAKLNEAIDETRAEETNESSATPVPSAQLTVVGGPAAPASRW